MGLRQSQTVFWQQNLRNHDLKISIMVSVNIAPCVCLQLFIIWTLPILEFGQRVTYHSGVMPIITLKTTNLFFCTLFLRFASCKFYETEFEFGLHIIYDFRDLPQFNLENCKAWGGTFMSSDTFYVFPLSYQILIHRDMKNYTVYILQITVKLLL